MIASFGTIWRLGIGAMLVVASVALDDSGTKSALIALGLGIIALDWIVRAARERNGIYVALAVYCAFAFAGFLVTSADDPPQGALYIVAGGTVLAAFGALVLAMAKGRSQKELDRLIFSEASSLAFFATMLAGITLGLLEAWLGFDVPSVWVLVFFGGAAWVGATFSMRRRYS